MQRLPLPEEIADHYARTMAEARGDYIHYRWGSSEVKRRHFRQTSRALQRVLGSVNSLGDVLEVGCGPAVWTPLYAGRARSVFLLDISQAMLEKAKDRLADWGGSGLSDKVTYHCGDFITAALEDARFDTIISVRALEYMSDKPAFTRKCHRLLRTGGSLIVVTKNRHWIDNTLEMKTVEKEPQESIPVEVRMQTDLLSWTDLMSLFRSSGFASARSFPVVVGSYLRPLACGPGLWACDLLHRLLYTRSLSPLYAPLVESFLTVGEKDVFSSRQRSMAGKPRGRTSGEGVVRV